MTCPNGYEPVTLYPAYSDYCFRGTHMVHHSDTTSTPAQDYSGSVPLPSEGWSEVDRNIIYDGRQKRTAQYLVSVTAVALNGSSGRIGNLIVGSGLLENYPLSQRLHEAALARLHSYQAHPEQLPTECREISDRVSECGVLSRQQIQGLIGVLENAQVPDHSTRNWIVGVVPGALGAAYAIHLFHALWRGAQGVPFHRTLFSTIATDFIGLVRDLRHPLTTLASMWLFIKNTWKGGPPPPPSPLPSPARGEGEQHHRSAFTSAALAAGAASLIAGMVHYAPLILRTLPLILDRRLGMATGLLMIRDSSHPFGSIEGQEIPDA